MQYYALIETWASTDFGICRSPGTNPPWIQRDDCPKDNGRWLGHEGGALMNEINVPVRDPQSSLTPLAMWGHSKKALPMNQEEGLHWNTTVLAPGSWTSQPPELWEISFFFFLFIYLFIYFWLCWVFIAVHGLSLVAVSGGYSSLRCVGFSLSWLLLSWSTGSRHAGFSSCGMWAQ